VVQATISGAVAEWPGARVPHLKQGRIAHAELHEDARVGDVVFVAKGDFVVAEAGAAARAVGGAAVVLVDHPGVPEPLEDPPARFDVVVVVGDVGVIEIGPEADALAQPRPFFDVAGDAFAAFFVEARDAIGLDFGLRLEAEFLFDFELDWQAVGIPAGLSRHAVAAHGLVARHDIFEDAREDVVDAGPGVRGWRAFVPDEEVIFGAFFDAAEEDRMPLPEVEDAFFERREGNLRVDRLEHCELRWAMLRWRR